MHPGKPGGDTTVLAGALMILPWIINVAPTGGRVRAGGMKPSRLRGTGITGEKQWLGTLYAEQGAPYCARESRGKDMRREDTKRKEMKEARAERERGTREKIRDRRGEGAGERKRDGD